jgi:hypothetical protein
MHAFAADRVRAGAARRRDVRDGLARLGLNASTFLGDNCRERDDRTTHRYIKMLSIFKRVLCFLNNRLLYEPLRRRRFAFG